MQALEEKQIECLACGAERVLEPGTETGECPRCGYLGWTYSEELDPATRRMIMNGAFGGHAATPRPLSR
jgi:hypothetical protein